MKTIEAYEKDILHQPLFLKKFKPQKILSENVQKNSIFCGGGDSLAAAMLAEAHSNFQVRAADPLDLLKNKALIKNKNVFLVSISGNTVSNIKVAKLARKSIAITSNPSSRLSKACSNTIHLQFPHSDVFTSGSLSFLQSALTCISLVSKIKIPDGSILLKKAIDESRKIKFGDRVFILGNFNTYPLAMYAAAKFYEVLGIDAHFERIEQFSHMELFSSRPSDTVIIFEEKNSHNIQLVQNLKKLGLFVFQPTISSTDKISQFIFYTFVSQLVPLFRAKKEKRHDCHFVTAKTIRKVSDKMIY
jgi:fructoselysine-6-P-deglycase FrlB-like protein